MIYLFKPSGHFHLPDIRPYFEFMKINVYSSYGVLEIV
jgi:hypothetical protein